MRCLYAHIGILLAPDTEYGSGFSSGLSYARVFTSYVDQQYSIKLLDLSSVYKYLPSSFLSTP